MQINLILKHCGAGIVQVEHDRSAVCEQGGRSGCAGARIHIGKAVGAGQVVVRIE
ncbi:hypothetical protein SDC9_111886 [bioreactor metagenome]|uniref:Uncharacterized protein n=1 Tax=bioreactor metagenome TaxID=1076179 RepID=A0A645BT68_9ZZZZ